MKRLSLVSLAVLAVTACAVSVRPEGRHFTLGLQP